MSDYARTKFNCLNLSISHVLIWDAMWCIGNITFKYSCKGSFVSRHSGLDWPTTPLNHMLISIPCGDTFTELKLVLSSLRTSYTDLIIYWLALNPFCLSWLKQSQHSCVLRQWYIDSFHKPNVPPDDTFIDKSNTLWYLIFFSPSIKNSGSLIFFVQLETLRHCVNQIFRLSRYTFIWFRTRWTCSVTIIISRHFDTLWCH